MTKKDSSRRKGGLYAGQPLLRAGPSEQQLLETFLWPGRERDPASICELMRPSRTWDGVRGTGAPGPALQPPLLERTLSTHSRAVQRLVTALPPSCTAVLL